MRLSKFTLAWAGIGCILAAISAVPVAAATKAETNADAAIDDAFAAVERWHQELGKFTSSVRVDEDDVKRFIEHYPALSELDEEERFQDRFDDDSFSFDQMLKDQQYRAWCRDKGLDPDKWMRKSMRIFALVMRDMSLQQSAMAEQQIPQQRKQFESMREQLGEEAYQAGIKALDSSMAMMQRSRKFWDRYESTTAETQLLSRYRDELAALMMDDDDSEEEAMWDDDHPDDDEDYDDE